MRLRDAATVWLTGMSGSGKTTLATLLAKELLRLHLRAEVLDGDVFRTTFSPELGFGQKDRDTNVKRIGYICEILSRNGVFAIAASIAPYRNARAEVRAMHGNQRFIEVYLDCPLSILIQRDTKGLYQRAFAGELAELTGVSDPYEVPDHPEITLYTGQESEGESLGRIMEWLKARHYLSMDSRG